MKPYHLIYPLSLLLTLLPQLLWSQKPADAANPDWQREIPRVVFPDKELVALYEKTWEIAADRVRVGPEGLPVSPYLDEHCYEDQIWIWDACFMVMFSRYAPAAYPGKQTLYNLYLPLHEGVETPLRIHLRDNPPLFAWVEYDNYQFTADREHLDYVFSEKQFLQRHYHYFDCLEYGHREPRVSPNPVFLRVKKDDRGRVKGYVWRGGASGMDNTPRGRDAGGYDKVFWVDAICQQALSALYISRLCGLYGMKSEEREWKGRYDALKKKINEEYWDEQDGFYYDIEAETGEPCRIKTPAAFWAMMAEIPDKRQAERMVACLRLERYFGGEYPWPSLSRDDPDYNHETGDYWRGGVWLPMVYMGTKALEKYGYYALADELAEKVVRQQLRTYHAVEPHTIWECYSPSKDAPSTEYGRRARPDFCGWSALGPISLFIENIMGFRCIDGHSGTIVWNLKKSNGTHGIKNLRFGSIRTDIVYDSDTETIRVDSDRKYTLMVNGKKYRIRPEGSTTIHL